MRLPALLFFIFLLLVGSTVAFAQSDVGADLQPVVLTEDQDKYPLGLYLEILEDPDGELTIDDVASPEFDSRFVASQVETPIYGFTDNAYWVRLALLNEAKLINRWLLEVGFANMNFVDLYTPLQDGEGFAVKQTGSLRPVSTRDIRHRDVVFELTLPEHGQQTYYLRFKSDASMTLPLTVWSQSAFLDHVQQDLLQYGLFFGVMFGLLGYNLFLLISLREKSYLFLTLFIANMIFFEATYAGFFETFVLTNFNSLKPYYQALSFSLIFAWALLFCHSFLEVQARIPKLHRVIIVILAVWAGLITLIPFIGFRTMALLMLPWGVISLLTLLVAGILSWRDGYRPARFFLVAWLVPVVTLTVVMLVRIGLISSTNVSENAYHLGLMWMVVCWSIALADRINLLKTETEATNRNLRSSEHQLSQILEGLPLGVVVYGRDFKPNYINQRVIEILGNPDQGIEPGLSAGRTLAEALRYYSIRIAGSDQDYPIEKMPIYQALHGEVASVDNAEVNLVNRRVPLEIWASPVFDDAGNVEAAVVAFQDITARKQVEQALQASEKKFRVVVENNVDGIGFLARDRQILYVSPSYARLVGMNVKELLGQSGVDFVHPDDRVKVAQVFGELLQRPGSRTTIEYRSRHHDGSLIWVETNAVNLLDDPRVGAVVLNIRNITERKKTEAELTDYRQKLETLVKERTEELKDAQTQIGTLFDTSPLGIALATFDGTILGVNRAMLQITGYSEDSLLQTNLEQLYADPEQRIHVLKQLEESGNLHDYGIKLRRQDRTIYYGSLSMSKLKLAGQDVLLKVIDDVSNQVQIREALVALHDIWHELATITDVTTLLNHALGRLYKIADFHRAALMLIEEGNESMTIYVYRSPALPPELTVNHVPINRFPSIEAILENRETAYVPDMLAVESIQADLDNIETDWWAAALKESRSWLSLPLKVGQQQIGLLNILHSTANRYKEEDVELARTFANQLAVAINNIKLQEQASLVAASNERSRIARDLHDSVTQVLFSASLVAEVLPKIWRRDPDKALESLEELRRLTRGALAEMRTMLLELRPESVLKTPLHDLLAQLTEAITGRIELPFQLFLENVPPLPEDVHTSFYRIAQEALNNVVKHAQANTVTVSLSDTRTTPEHAATTRWTADPGGLRLQWAQSNSKDQDENAERRVKLVIEDDGVGYSIAKKGAIHLGTGIMEERAAVIQADLSMESQPGYGTRVSLVWPGESENS